MYRRLLLLSLTMGLMACAKEGPQGPQGPAGPAGVNGLSGTDNRIVASIFCLGVISGVPGAAGVVLNGLWVGYSADLTASDDVYASGFLRTPAFQVGSAEFYAANQVGAQTGAVIFTADVATSNYGFWQISLNRATLVVTAVYTDDSLGVQSPVVVTFQPDACTAQTW